MRLITSCCSTKVGLSQALVDALGAAAAVLVSFLAQQMLSVARYRDPSYGAENALQHARDEAARRLDVATEVSHSLAQVPHLNNILVGQAQRRYHPDRKRGLQHGGAPAGRRFRGAGA